VGWGLRFGRHYLLMTSGLQIAGMGYNMLFSDYWRHNQMFGAVVIMAMLANTINVAILLRRIAWGNHRLEEKTEEIARLAWQDQLTKLPNRLYFHERLSQTIASADRTQRRIALILFDIDGFKTVNDTLGHEAGDRLLQEISRCVGSRIRQADTFARLGGDEFVVIMDSLRDEADARLVAETILRTIAEIDLFAAQGLRIGASVGVACGAGRREIPDLLKQADRAMYAAKRAGKGCYRFADESRGGAA
jgi:diguanylate cyclase (GGDEF)-like protein